MEGKEKIQMIWSRERTLKSKKKSFKDNVWLPKAVAVIEILKSNMMNQTVKKKNHKVITQPKK